jgi:uncharacterized protein (TIGR02145 family)
VVFRSDISFNYIRSKQIHMRFFILSCLFCAAIAVSAQVPALMPYQAIARDAAGQPLASANINARFTIHDAMPSGAVVWQEIQTVSTTSLGLFTVQLGSAVPLTDVNWASGNKFMQVEVDLGNGFTDIGTQQMLSVPYALYSGAVSVNVSEWGDTLFVGNNSYVIIPGLSEANHITVDNTLHTCGIPDVHNSDLTYGTMNDQEGNTYKTINIGSQEWMAENLNTSTYRNGDLIQTGLSDVEWGDTFEGAWTYYDNDMNMSCPFGKLYNWFSCIDSRNICPIGWHIPSQSDWQLLITALGGGAVAGGKMKSTNSTFWTDPSNTASNSSGFSGLPTGIRTPGGSYGGSSSMCIWWSSTMVIGTNMSNPYAYYIWLYPDNGTTFNENDTYGSAWYGYSVRCVRD